MAHGMTARDTAVYVAEPAWHGLGTVLADYAEPEEVWQASGLDWEVTKEPTYDKHGQPSSRFFYVVRSDIPETEESRILGAVGAAYTPITNRQAFFDIVMRLMGKHVKFETAGSILGGAVVYMLAVLPERLRIVDDEVVKYLLLSNSHDGSRRLVIRRTPIRVVCQNTLTWALAGQTDYQFHIRHTKSALNNLDEAARVLGLAERAFAADAGLMTKFAQESVNSRFVDAYLKALVPDPAKEGASTTRATKVRDRIQELFEGRQMGADMRAVRGTAYGLYSATTQFIDHERTTRLGSRSRSIQESRFSATMFGSGADLRNTAARLLADQLGVLPNRGQKTLSTVAADN